MTNELKERLDEIKSHWDDKSYRDELREIIESFYNPQIEV